MYFVLMGFRWLGRAQLNNLVWRNVVLAVETCVTVYVLGYSEVCPSMRLIKNVDHA
jgi:hypothetical protein